MVEVPLNVHYDAEEDIFSAWTRQPEHAVGIEPREGIVLRVDADTDELVGYTLIDCFRQFRDVADDELTLPLVPDAALAPLRAQLRLLREHFSSAA